MCELILTHVKGEMGGHQSTLLVSIIRWGVGDSSTQALTAPPYHLLSAHNTNSL